MNELKTVELTNGGYSVDLKTRLTWYASQEIEAILVGGAKMDGSGLSGYDGEALMKSRLKAMELLIAEIRKDDKKIPFSQDWVKQLDVSDGNTLMEAIDKITSPKKKSS